MRVDGEQVAEDGTWPGLHPTVERIDGDSMTIDLAAGEACAITVHAHEEAGT